ncbi:extracellular solute-binding protein [Shouchella patagoniensis]|uniref:extracellular solute-binding protein n=1 Tax=Shouchella patagoniensis TaxID=228576 RepID=UPI000994971A|nr:extracellular solute-binding protein [Shouchella patagoniensis]
MKKRSLVYLSALAMSIGALSACNSVTGGGDDNTIVVYSNATTDGGKEWWTEKAAEEGFTLEIVDGGGGEIINRLMAEQNQPIADVVWGLNNMYFERLKEAELLETFKPEWADEIDPAKGDADNTFHPIVDVAILAIYNSEVYDENTAPQDWPDLWEKEEFHGKYQLPENLSSATAQNVLAGLMSRYRDDNGELGVSEEGWQAITDYYSYGEKTVSTEENYTHLASGDLPIMQMGSHGLGVREVEFGVESSYATPQIGVPLNVEQVGIIQGKDNQETLEEFVNWFGSAEMQSAYSEEFKTMPSNENARDKVDEGMAEIFSNVSLQEIDWTWVNEHMENWVEKIELEIL